MRGFETGIEKCARIYTRDSKTRVIWGDKCSTDGQGNIFLPALSDRADKKVLTQTRLYLGHEVSHVRHSDWSAIDRAVKSGGGGKKTILNALEDVRIERLWELEYTGCQEDFRQNYKWLVEKEFNKRLVSPMESVFSKVLNITTIRAREKQLGFDTGLNVPAPIEKLFQEKVADLIDAIASATTMKQIEDLTEEVYKRFKDDQPPSESSSGGDSSKGGGSKKDKKNKSKEEKEDGPENSGDDEKPNSGDANGTGEEQEENDSDEKGSDGDQDDDEDGDKDNLPGSSSDDPSGTEDDASDSGEGDEEDEEDPKGGKSASDKKQQKLREELKDDVENDADVSSVQDATANHIKQYAETCDEYFVDPDVIDNIYKPYFQPADTDQARALMKEGKDILSYLGQRLRHLFLTVRSRRMQRFLKTGPLDSYRIMEDESDLICKKVLKGRNKDSVVGTLLDCSGSMHGPKYTMAVKLSLGMSHFLEQIKVPMAMVGFTMDMGCGYSKIRNVPARIAIMKEFHESMVKVMGRLTAFHQFGCTPDLDGLKVLAPMVLSRPEPKKIILVYSDGQPEIGDGDLNNRLRNSYKMYINRLRKAGVIVYGFGIETDVTHIFGADHCAYVSMYNVHEFPKTVFKQLTKLLLE